MLRAGPGGGNQRGGEPGGEGHAAPVATAGLGQMGAAAAAAGPPRLLLRPRRGGSGPSNGAQRRAAPGGGGFPIALPRRCPPPRGRWTPPRDVVPGRARLFLPVPAAPGPGNNALRSRHGLIFRVERIQGSGGELRKLPPSSLRRPPPAPPLLSRPIGKLPALRATSCRFRLLSRFPRQSFGFFFFPPRGDFQIRNRGESAEQQLLVPTAPCELFPWKRGEDPRGAAAPGRGMSCCHPPRWPRTRLGTLPAGQSLLLSSPAPRQAQNRPPDSKSGGGERMSPTPREPVAPSGHATG